MKMINFIDGQRDNRGNYQVLWCTGNYSYEIECRNTGKKIVLRDTSFEDAKALFLSVLVSY